MTRPNPNPHASAMFKVFIKGQNGQWSIASRHTSREDAELTAHIITSRQGLVTKVML